MEKVDNGSETLTGTHSKALSESRLRAAAAAEDWRGELLG